MENITCVDSSDMSERMLKLQDEILEIQSKLGQKMMFDAKGKALKLAAFTLERKKLKDACVWRQREAQKIRSELKKLRLAKKAKITDNQVNRSKIVGLAFSLLCDDVAAGVGTSLCTDSGVASLYMAKAATIIEGNYE